MALPILSYEHATEDSQTEDEAGTDDVTSTEDGSDFDQLAAAKRDIQRALTSEGSPRRVSTKPRNRLSTVMEIVVDRLLAAYIETESELLEITRSFTGNELLQAAEERCLSRHCGNPLCGNELDSLRSQHSYLFSEIFCRSECEQSTRRLAKKLGDELAAIGRHTAAAAAAEALQPHKGESLYAAGNAALPIMLSEVQERNPQDMSSPESPTAQQREDANGFSVEGFSTRHRPNGAIKRDFGESDRSRGSAHVSAVQPPKKAGWAALKQCKQVSFADDPPLPSSRQEEDQAAEPIEILEDAQAARGNPSSQGHPVLVFDVEDPQSVIDGSLAGLSQQYGSLRLQDSPDGEASPRYDTDESDEGEEDSVESDDAASEALSDELQDDVGPDDAEDEAVEGGTHGWYSEHPGEGYACHMSVFGQVHAALENLISDETIAFCRGAALPAARLSETARGDQVLEVLKQLMSQCLTNDFHRALRISVPRSSVERHLLRLLLTFNLDIQLPSLMVSSWRLLLVVLLKGLSMEQVPALRSSFEGPEALLRLSNLQLAGLDRDRFSALVDILLPEPDAY